jgi:hypothetical protein
MAKVKIPKRVAGMKIPKKVRRKANKALKMADNSGVRELAAAALGAAASTRRASRGVRVEVNGEILNAARSVRVDAERVADAFRNAALEGLRSFVEGLEEGLRERGVTIDVEAREAPANDSDGDDDEKKPTRRSPGAGAAEA